MNYSNKTINKGRRTLIPAKEPQCVINYAMIRLDRYGETSEKKLREALCNKTDNQQWVEMAVARMIELGYLCDLRYALMIVRNGVDLKGWGKRRIEQSLKNKGIKSDVAAQAMLSIEDDDQLTRSVFSLSKKFSSKIEYRDQKNYARAVRYLVGQGFGFDVITDTIKQFNETFDA
ncbi:regulatory protein RecX [Vibrio coralliirubri]|uniref:regulatory protein RecX n=1 Tax=Vibrio coralliirubri TaxID=1516159 RepID=UPI002283F08D|nr:regulatory protein RecX [Vibrio coralliirubri]MCY9861311.1 regulatory protein RecX [Vibrio coralliirubri]